MKRKNERGEFLSLRLKYSHNPTIILFDEVKRKHNSREEATLIGVIETYDEWLRYQKASEALPRVLVIKSYEEEEMEWLQTKMELCAIMEADLTNSREARV